MGSDNSAAYVLFSPEWWLRHLSHKLLQRQARYDELENWATGNHPLPDGDKKYVKALRELQEMSGTNYIKLINDSVTKRMRVKAFTFGEPEGEDESQKPQEPMFDPGKPVDPNTIVNQASEAVQNMPPKPKTGDFDPDAKRIWDASNGQLFGTVCIDTAATFGDCYAMVSPPDPDDPAGLPLITFEDPRQCVVEPDPINPYKAVAGLKLYRDNLTTEIVAVLMLPDAIYEFRSTPYGNYEKIEIPSLTHDDNGLVGTPGLFLYQRSVNTLGKVPLVRGNWQPWHGPLGIAECENTGAFAIQKRINWTVLSRLLITKQQAYRQRMISGLSIKKPKKGQPAQLPFEPGADALWVMENPDAKLWDLDQADITQLLEAIRDDVGDMAAITQTPATYLLNKMVNVSGDTLAQDQAALLSKVKFRMEAMGWFFEQVMRLAFSYMGDERADEPVVQVLWHDPEVHKDIDLADLAAKWSAAGIPLELIMDKLGFEPNQIGWAAQQAAQKEAQQLALQQQQAQQQHEQNLESIKAGGAAKAAGKPPTSTNKKP